MPRLRWFALPVIVVLAATAVIGLLSPLQAQNQVINISEGQRTASISVAVGKSQTLRVTEPFEDVIIGNPEIADAAPLTDQMVYVLGREIGTTNLALYNQARELIAVIDVEVTFDVTGLREALATALPGARIRVRTIAGRVMLEGAVHDAITLDKALAIAADFAGEDVTNALTVASPQQVMLEVRIIEATRNLGRDLGINWSVQAQGFRFSTLRTARDEVTGDVVVAAPLATGGTPFGQILSSFLAGGARVDVLIQALEEKGVARRLAEPNLIALSGQPASFHAGGEVPISTIEIDEDDEGNLTQTQRVIFKKFGVLLAFTPTVLADGVINLKIEPEVSDIDFSIAVRGNPGIRTRTASTMVELRDGQSLAMAGLLQTSNNRQADQIPWLGDIPILGALFRSSGFQKNETELVVIVTPRLVAPVPPGTELATPLDNLNPSNDAELVLLGELEVTKEFKHLVETGGAVKGPFGHMLDLPKAKHDVLITK